MKKAVAIGPLIVAVLIVALTVCHAEQDSPVDVVKSFSACYGGACMDETANCTTRRFRDNKPRSVWVVDTWRALREMKYRRLDSTVIDSRANDNSAAVVIDATIETAAGETNQKEVYFLIKGGQEWLIDELQVTDENIEINGEKIKL